MLSFNGGEDTGRLQGRTCGKRIHRTKRIKKVGTIQENLERPDTIQNRERSCHPPRSLKVQSYNGRPGRKSPFHPNAKVWIEGISCKAIQSVLTGRPCSLSLRSHGLVANGWNGAVCGMSKGWLVYMNVQNKMVNARKGSYRLFLSFFYYLYSSYLRL